ATFISARLPSDGGVEGQIQVQAVSLGLVPLGPARRAGAVAAGLHDRAHDHLQVNAASPGSAVIEIHPGESGAHLVPHGIEAFDVANLADTLSVGGIVLPPEWERVYVEVVAVGMDVEIGDLPDEEVREPASRLGIAEVQQAARARRFVGGEDKLGMFARKLRVPGHALRLIPDEELQTQLLAGLAHGLQAVGKLLRLGEPVADAVREVALKPAGVEPQGVAAKLAVHFGGGDLPCLGGPVRARAAGPAVEGLGSDG